MTPSARMPLIRRRRWYPSKTVYSAAQAEMELIGGGTTQLEMDLGDPVPSGAQRPPAPTEAEPVDQGDLFGYLAESPEPTPQIEFDGMAKPVFAVRLSDGREARFQHASSLLESLESQDIHIEYQCREGYCGSCRMKLKEGDVHYTTEPMAWIDDDEILPCCCIPVTPLVLQ